MTQNLRGENSSSPESFPAERVLPAPRAGERTLSAFLHWLRPLRPAPGTVRSRPARAETCNIRQYNPRALLEIKNNRFPLHKRPVSTYPFPLTPAFLQPSASGEMSALSRPDLPPSRGGRGIPVGAAPLRANLSDTFPFVGKGIPRAGSAYQTVFDCEKSEVKLQSSRGAK